MISAYRELWKIEESFRVLKSVLDARPVYVWTEKRIQDALRSANVTVMETVGMPYFLKNEAHQIFQVILETLGIEQLPVYGNLKDLRMHNTEI